MAEKSVFMLGDELLIVPLVSESSRLSFYLPQGIWTGLATNERHQGRQKLEIAAGDRLPVRHESPSGVSRVERGDALVVGRVRHPERGEGGSRRHARGLGEDHTCGPVRTGAQVVQ